MISPTHGDIVNRLKDEYSEGIMYGKQTFSAFGDISIRNSGFMGAESIAFLSSQNSIIHEAPACIAALFVNMVARNIISLGMTGQGSQPLPVRLYAPNQLSITAKHVLIGDLMMLVVPEHGFISCKKLTLSKFTDEDPSHFEIVKSWIINEDVEIETIYS